LKLNSNKSVSINGQAPTQRIAQKGNTIENNQQTNENTTMNKKQKIRLSESALRRIINEVVANTLEKDLAGNTIYDLGNGYTTSDLDGMIRSLKDKLSYLNDKHARLYPTGGYAYFCAVRYITT